MLQNQVCHWSLREWKGLDQLDGVALSDIIDGGHHVNIIVTPERGC